MTYLLSMAWSAELVLCAINIRRRLKFPCLVPGTSWPPLPLKLSEVAEPLFWMSNNLTQPPKIKNIYEPFSNINDNNVINLEFKEKWNNNKKLSNLKYFFSVLLLKQNYIY